MAAKKEADTVKKDAATAKKNETAGTTRKYQKRSDWERLQDLQRQMEKVHKKILSQYRDVAMDLFMLTAQHDVENLIKFLI